ncbi:MAG: stage II sporulation protein R [Oscillospiraceae bacterium]|nr:stage II sporulation protein R [Oscillospiraceae bacterium]
MKKAIQLFFILLLAFAAVNIGKTGLALRSLEHSVIRLHILANSDATADQTRKLLVRDALLTQAASWIPENADFETGCAALQSHLPEIQQTAEQTLRAAGCGDAVQVSLEQTAFPARTYGDFTLPEGEYQALRVEIGAAAGQNWWCVMYPAMCIPAAAVPADDVLGDAACDLAENPEEYEVRLKCVELYRAVSKWVTQKIAETASNE